MPPVAVRLLRAGVALAGVAALSGCGGGGAKAQLTSHGVRVHITYEKSGQLVATFTPTQAGFHLYSKDLPEGGINGLGFPTRLQAARGITFTGPLTANLTPTALNVQTLGVTLPVYPDGPVTITAPAQAGTASTATVLVSYAACSSTLCLPPLVNQAVTVSLH
jgi:hypothetical protein